MPSNRTPVVPTVFAFLGGSTPQIFGFGGRIQGFVATYEIVILMVALALMVFALHFAAKGFSVRPAPHGHPSPD